MAWSPDGGTLVSASEQATVRFWEVNSGRLQTALLALPEERFLIVQANGHYLGSPDIERDLVYVVQTDQGQEMLSPEEFTRKYGWKNDPERVTLNGR